MLWKFATAPAGDSTAAQLGASQQLCRTTKYRIVEWFGLDGTLQIMYF